MPSMMRYEMNANSKSCQMPLSSKPTSGVSCCNSSGKACHPIAIKMTEIASTKTGLIVNPTDGLIFKVFMIL